MEEHPVEYNYKNLKIITPKRNNEFELPDASYKIADIQAISWKKEHAISPIISPIHIYINRINNILVLKIKDAYKIELQTPKTVKSFAREE